MYIGKQQLGNSVIACFPVFQGKIKTQSLAFGDDPTLLRPESKARDRKDNATTDGNGKVLECRNKDLTIQLTMI